MKVIQKVFSSLALSAIVLTAVPISVSAETPGTIHQDFPMLTQALPDGGKIVTANSHRA